MLEVEYQDRLDLLFEKWSEIKNPDQYLDQLNEYDLGKILTVKWHNMVDPEDNFKRIEDPFLRNLVIKNRDISP